VQDESVSDHDADPTPDPDVRVTVTRTGGFAGLRREWCATGSGAEASTWHELVAQCPWDAVEPPTAADEAVAERQDAAPGPDRFSWRIRVDEHGTPTHRAALGEQHVEGPWADLIEAVRRAHG
jgi:hypothetical protein